MHNASFDLINAKSEAFKTVKENLCVKTDKNKKIKKTHHFLDINYTIVAE